MPCGVMSGVGRGMGLLDWGSTTPMERGGFLGGSVPLV